MRRYGWIACGMLALVLAGCGRPAAVSPNEAIGRVALIEPTAAPTTTPTAPPTATGTPRPTATLPPLPTPTATVPLHANGRIPQGWRIYVGTSVPLSIAHHGDWTAQRQKVADNDEIFFSAPDQRAQFAIMPHDDLAAGLPRLMKLSNAELEDALFASGLTTDGGALGAMCDGATEFDGVTRTTIAQSLFITLDFRCRFQGTPSRIAFSMGMVGERAWVVLTVAPAAEYADHDARYFAPMLASLKFD